MKDIEQLKSSGRIVVVSEGTDGGMGYIYTPKWNGTVVWSWALGWEHVSVAPSKKHIIPSWDDMCMIKDLFFNDEECVVQFHPPKSAYVNNVPNCLHLWKPTDEVMPMPPAFMVGVS